MRRSRTVAARSAALAAHEFHPADRSRLAKWLSDQRRLSRLRTACCHRACQPTHPRDSARRSRRCAIWGQGQGQGQGQG